MMKRTSFQQRPRKPKRKHQKESSPNHYSSLLGPARVVENFRDATFQNVGRLRFRKFEKSSVSGNFVDPNPFSWSRANFDFPVGTVELDSGTFNWARWSGSHTYYDGALLSFDVVAPYIDSVDSEDAYRRSVLKLTQSITVRKFLSQLRESESQFAVDIAESKKSYDMVSQRLAQIIQIARAVRRRAFAFSRRNPNKLGSEPWNQVARLWLEVKYGWLPLTSSAFNAVDYLRNRTKNGKFRIRSSHVTKVLMFYERTNSLGFRHLARQRVSTRCTYSGDYQVSCAWLNNASRFVGLNPLSIAWELIPYSFVADWFVDIGGYLQDYETAVGAGLSFKRGWSTYVHDVSTDHFIPAGKFTANGRTHLNLTNVEFKSQWRDKRRTVLTQTPRPFLPGFEPKLGAQRIISGAALLLGLLTKFNRSDRFNDRTKFDPWGPGWKYL